MSLEQQQRRAYSLANVVPAQELRQLIKEAIQEFRIQDIFIQSLGWEYLSQSPTQLSSASHLFSLNPLAHKRGFAVYLCMPDYGGTFPDYQTRRQIDRQVRERSYEHFVIYVDRQKSRQIWQWVERQPGGKEIPHEHHYYRGQDGEALLQKVQRLFISFEEEERLSLEHVIQKVHQSFDVDRITKKFYEAFKEEHRYFMLFIRGIAHEVHREWYTSVMLSRLMLVYFIQKKGFLDGDEEYLANHLALLRKKPEREHGFFSFYCEFLLRLFHEGFGQSEHSPQWEEEFGYIPYLNGGLFEKHQLERLYTDIQIPDEAFEHIFAFLGQWQWHLDTREGYNDNEINPDVLGYIFEQFTNQKEMGAYYTKEEVTEYIARQAIIAHLNDHMRKNGTDLFAPSSLGQTLLYTQPMHYLYPGMTEKTNLSLPSEIADGLTDVTRRAPWIQPAPETHAFPTETWRDVIERRQQVATLQEKLAKGKITSMEDLVAANLDLVALFHDILRHNQSSELLAQLYRALSQMTLLDPTCGSGAFLLAAIRLLQPLYELCLQQMEVFLAQTNLEPARHPGTVSEHPSLIFFREILQQFAHHTNRDFFVLKSIVVNNLYGVDIKPEVVEICRLRLFLKLLAQIDTIEDLEPLPDVDFNVYSGNSLLGFTTLDEVRRAISGDIQLKMDPEQLMDQIDESTQQTNVLYRAFLAAQYRTETSSLEKDHLKEQLQAHLDLITKQLNTYLAREYGIGEEKFEQWIQNARPFHWFIRFYDIMMHGGFSVIIGNPPYVEYKNVQKYYTVHGYATIDTKNLYALVIERSTALLAPGGRFGMIVPSSATCTEGYMPLQRLIVAQSTLHVASFSDQRGKLFAIPHPRLCIIAYQKREPTSLQPTRIFATPYLKLEPKIPASPFERLFYTEVTGWLRPGVIPRFGSTLEYSIARKLFAQKHLLGHFVRQSGHGHVYYTRKLSWFVQVTPFKPIILDAQGKQREPSELKTLRFATQAHANLALTALNSNLFYWFLTIGSDCRNLNKREVEGLPLGMDSMDEDLQEHLSALARELEESLQQSSQLLVKHYPEGPLTIQCIFPVRSKQIIDKIDLALASHYGFTAEEADFLITYDGKYRNKHQLSQEVLLEE